MPPDTVTVIVDADLEDLIPGFMDNRRKDVSSLRDALSAGDMDGIRVIGHSMKGTGGGYGFDGISDIGAGLEGAAREGDASEIERLIERLDDYLAGVVVKFE